jgi:hypothetical protein
MGWVWKHLNWKGAWMPTKCTALKNVKCLFWAHLPLDSSSSVWRWLVLLAPVHPWASGCKCTLQRSRFQWWHCRGTLSSGLWSRSRSWFIILRPGLGCRRWICWVNDWDPFVLVLDKFVALSESHL